MAGPNSFSGFGLGREKGEIIRTNYCKMVCSIVQGRSISMTHTTASLEHMQQEAIWTSIG